MKNTTAKAIILTSMTLLLSMTLLITLASLANPVTAAINPTVLIDLSHSNTHGGDLDAFVSDLTVWGFEVVLARGGINSTILADVDIFVQSMPMTNFTADETAALASWFAGGNKAVWLATDSDFTTGPSVEGPIYQNALLEAMGSKLRFEPCSVESPDINVEAVYRVLVPIFNRAPGLAYSLTANVRMGFFHGPAILCGWNGTDHVALETVTLANVTWIAKTSGSSVLVETDPTYLAYAHTEGQKGPFVIMAAEELGTNKIVASGEAIFTIYKLMYHYPGERNYPQDDKILVRNVFAWFKGEVIPDPVEPTILNTITVAPLKVLIDLRLAPYLSPGSFDDFVSDLTAWGFEVVLARGGINSTILADVDVFIQTMPVANLTADETAALVSWFAGGNKAVWLATDSDFTTGPSVEGPIYQNALLKALGSKLRFEPCSVESPDINVEAPYRVLVPIFNRAPGLAYSLTANVRMGFFHGPAILCGWNGTAHVALETVTLANVTWIAKTSGASVLVETDPTYLAYAHTEGQKGPFVIMAAEEIGTNKIVASGEAIFTLYKSMYHYPGERNYPQDDMILVKNVFNWLAVETVIETELAVSAVPTSVMVETNVTFAATYTTSGILAENLTAEVSVPVENASVTVSIDTISIPAEEVAPGEYNATWETTTLGSFTWNVTATKDGHQTGTTSGSIEVVPEFQGLMIILLLTPIVAIAIITAKKRRLLRLA